MSNPPVNELHRRATDLLLDVLEVAPNEREAWLEARRLGPGVRREVLALLRSHERAENDDDFLSPALRVNRSDGTETPRLLDPETLGIDIPDPRTGTRVGPWRLTDRIGTGGMGAVYRAVRDDGAYHRTVAVKVLRPGSDTAVLARRLDAEGRVLARLEHPGIARLYDSGIADDGTPYLALEYVDGEPITDAVRHFGLTVRQRVELFLDVCDATANAHLNLVVHRDIKPSNVFVTPGRKVRLLDFGIATLLDDTDRSEATVLEAEPGALTPAYAAPEQLRREPVTLATDVYALGVVLYELLAGERPYKLSDLTASQIERVLCEDVPPAPSTKAGRADARAVSGDLDTIVLKALEKEPARRYQSAEALRSDLQRHLDGLPVLARLPTISYRALSFTRRHRLGVAATAVVLLAMILGLGTAVWQARVASHERDRAERRFEIARETVNALLFETHDAIALLPGSTPIREQIVSTSLAFLSRLSEDAGDDVRLRLDIARAYQRIADVQGNPTNANLGRMSSAVLSYRRGLEILPLDGVPDSLINAVRYAEGAILGGLGDIVAFTTTADSALTYQRQATRLFELNVEHSPEDPDEISALATSVLIEGDYTGNPNFPNAGRPNEALGLYSRALALLERTLEIAPEHEKGLRMLGMVHERRGTVFEMVGDRDAALDSYQASMEVRSRLARAKPLDAVARRNLGIAHEKLGVTYQEFGQLSQARRELETASGIYEELGRSDPDDANAKLTIAFGEINLGNLAWSTDIPSERNRALFRRHYDRAVLMLTELVAADPANQRTRGVLDDAVRARGAR